MATIYSSQSEVEQTVFSLQQMNPSFQPQNPSFQGKAVQQQSIYNHLIAFQHNISLEIWTFDLSLDILIEFRIWTYEIWEFSDWPLENGTEIQLYIRCLLAVIETWDFDDQSFETVIATWEFADQSLEIEIETWGFSDRYL